ncbi:FIST signal transduction protein [Pelagibius sp.]|uniref:FIST signal transduction protein n=1 Tax=Pelagibius sp. TaxID=1931238 RepID=UPI003B50868C
MTAEPLTIGSQTAGRYKSAYAVGDPDDDKAWGSVAAACVEALGSLPERANLGFVYATGPLADDLGSIVTFLRERCGIADWVGTVGAGVMASGEEIYDRPALSVLVAALPEDSYRLFAPVTGGLEDFTRQHGDWVAAHKPILGVVHGDPRNPLIVDVVEAVSEATSAFLIGGLTAVEGEDYPQVSGTVAAGGLSGVLFSSEQLAVAGLSQGCTPIGEPHEVTEMAGEGVVASLDGRPVLDVLREEVGELLARDLRRIGGYIYAALPIAGSDTGDYLVRNLIGMDLERQWLQIGADLSVGDRLAFCRRDHASAKEDMQRMLRDLSERAGGAPRAALYVSCVARGRHLFGTQSEELRLIRETFGDIPLTGFFANGEISNNRLYGYTGVLTLLL